MSVSEDETKKSDRVSPLSDSDAAFYGYLCKLSDRIDAASGCGLMVLAGVLCAATGWALWTYVTSSAWLFVSGPIIVYGWAWSWLDDRLEKRVFDEEQLELERRARAAGLSHDQLVGLLAGDGEVDGVYRWLKKQTDWSST